VAAGPVRGDRWGGRKGPRARDDGHSTEGSAPGTMAPSSPGRAPGPEPCRRAAFAGRAAGRDPSPLVRLTHEERKKAGRPGSPSRIRCVRNKESGSSPYLVRGAQGIGKQARLLPFFVRRAHHASGPPPPVPAHPYVGATCSDRRDPLGHAAAASGDRGAGGSMPRWHVRTVETRLVGRTMTQRHRRGRPSVPCPPLRAWCSEWHRRTRPGRPGPPSHSVLAAIGPDGPVGRH
jgi:hypothetical protein